MTPLRKCLAVLALLFAIGQCGSHGAATNRELTVQVLNVDKKRDGPVDLKVELRVARDATTSIKVECLHLTLGTGDWLMRVLGVESTTREPGTVVKQVTQLVADSVPLVEATLRRDFGPHSLRSIHLVDTNMPVAFMAPIYGAVAAQMNRLSSGPETFIDRRIGRMIQAAFDDNDLVRSIRKRLEEQGFVVEVTHTELTVIRRNLAGKTWKNIAAEPAAGLEPGAASVWFLIRRKQEK